MHGDNANTLLYAGFPEPGRPNITHTRALDSIYKIELRFENDPDLGGGVRLGPGKVSRLQIRVSGKSAASKSAEFFYLFRNKTR